MSKDDVTKEDALRDRKLSLLCTLEMMTSIMKPGPEGEGYPSEEVDNWLTSWNTLESLNRTNFRALMEHNNYFFHWMGHEMDLSSEEVFDKYVEFFHESVIPYLEHRSSLVTPEEFQDAGIIFDMEQTLKEDDNGEE